MGDARTAEAHMCCSDPTKKLCVPKKIPLTPRHMCQIIGKVQRPNVASVIGSVSRKDPSSIVHAVVAWFDFHWCFPALEKDNVKDLFHS